MNKFQKKLVSVLATGSLVVQLLAAGPAFAASTTIEISGNGTSSTNNATVNLDSSVVVNQNNTANIKNDVDANSSTGGNDANNNTGGDVSVTTGDAKTDVKVANDVNHNAAQVNCCPTGDASVEISGNGSYSQNNVDLKVNQDKDSGIYVNQDNYAKVKNDIDANAKTGYNDANNNTGGSVDVTTGNAKTKVDVSTAANTNMAVIGGNDGGSQGLISMKILGNGTHSDNDIKLDFDRTIVVDQDNVAKIKNDIDADAKTGGNDANNNTGGDVSLTTGNAETDVDVDNNVNFNWADLSCGCLLDVTAKIAGNGADSDNDIKAKLLDEQFVDQSNVCGKKYGHEGEWGYRSKECLTDVDANAKTGHNDVNNTTGTPEGGDPSISTGDATTSVDVGNSGNVNIVGGAPEFTWPDLPDFPNFEFNFNMGWLWFFLGGSA